MDTHEHPIQKKIGLPRMIATLAGIAIVGIGASWFGKNQKSEPASHVAQESTIEFSQPSRPPELPPQNSTSPEKTGELPILKDTIQATQPAVSSLPTPAKNIQKKETPIQEIPEQKQPAEQPREESRSAEQRVVEQTEPITPKVEQPIIEQKNIVTKKKEFSDGTYAANGAYTSPAGEEEINISLILKDEVIIDSKFTSKAVNPSSKQWQNIFGSGYREKIIGKPISTLSLTAVSGSSLTPRGFMDALEKIKRQAKNAS